MSDWLAWISILALLAVWLGYPAAMLVLASTRRRSLHSGTPLPSVSVVIASRESPAVVARKVQNVLQGRFPREYLQVVVAMDASRPSLASLPGIADDRVVLVQGMSPGKPSALNVGVEAARGEIVVLTDTHQMLDVRAVMRLAGRFSDASVGVVSGFLELKPEDHSTPMDGYWRLERQLRWAEGIVASSIGVTGALYAIRRSLWRPLPDDLLLDDVYVPMRAVLAGHRVVMDLEAIAFETRSSSPELEYRRKARTLAGNIQLLRLLPDVINPAQNPVWLQFVFHKMLRLLTPFLIVPPFVWLVGSLMDLVTSPSLAFIPLLALLFLVVAAISRRGRYLLKWFAYLQLATLMGVLYGISGRTDIWRESAPPPSPMGTP